MDLFSLSPDEAKKRIEELVDTLNNANRAYYTDDKPLMTDYEFDLQLKELTVLERDFPEYMLLYSPTQRVGGEILKTFKSIEHSTPMLSLGNTYSAEEIEDFDERLRKSLGDKPFTYVCELKYDGVSISLIYENGFLVRGITRGDGVKGDDVTENVKTIASIPLHLGNGDFPDYFEIRGEIIMSHKVFDELNSLRESVGEEPFANPRNAASGSLKLLDPKQTAQRKLDCFLYFLLGSGISETNHIKRLGLASKWGFKTGRYYKECATLKDVFEFINYWDKARENLPFDIDGVVIKVNQTELWNDLGITAKSPRWAMAYKFKAQRVSTRLLDIGFQVGRTGAVTPVAHLEAVRLAGSIIRRASLHNADIIERLDVRIGDVVYVEKGGEVIPKIVGVDMSHRDKNSAVFEFTKLCPECKTPLVRNLGEAIHYCLNEDYCPPQIKGKLSHFISRKAMDINSLGQGKIEMLYDKGLLKNVADLYSLTYKDLYALKKDVGASSRQLSFKEKTAINILDGVAASKKIPFERVLFALGIRYVGEATAKLLARHFGSIDILQIASKEALLEVDEVGEVVAQSIIDYFNKEEHKHLIERLKAAGLQMECSGKWAPGAKTFIEDNSSNLPLSGSVWVVSGLFSRSREEMQHLIEEHGGRVSSSVSGKTTAVLAGENMGPEKRRKAEALGVEIVEELEFMRRILGE